MQYVYYVYILKSERDNNLYIGKTNNVKRRIAEHNYGHTPSTRSRRPLKLLEFIECATQAEAIRMEKERKKGYKREELRKKYGEVAERSNAAHC